ncbi:MAG: GNAT family N-acetyltransferase [Rubrivivax sp.]|jgi:RimJ/RimL family protein N-acetyltransferase|nr:GNAT family N-acetyltransferase [Rubrivivax sp.]
MNDVLLTARLRLEPQCAAHADEMHAVLGDPAIYAYENDPPPSVAWLRERYARLESRRSPDGLELWLNWVLRLHDGPAIGYVQATVHAGGRADVAYVLASAWWGQGLATEGVHAMAAELHQRHGVRVLHAVLKSANLRSLSLLQRMGFVSATAEEAARAQIDADERLMVRALAD